VGIPVNYAVTIALKIFFLCSNTQYCAGDKIDKNELGGVCNADGGEDRRVQGFGGKTCGKRDYWGDLGVDGSKY
jgi:hypothetical protein